MFPPASWQLITPEESRGGGPEDAHSHRESNVILREGQEGNQGDTLGCSLKDQETREIQGGG